MLRDYQPGNRITSIAVQDLGLGTIIVPSLTNVIVEWDDGTWSKERYQDIIFIGQSKNEPLPIPGEGGFKKKLVGSNDKQKDGSRRLDFEPQEKFDDPSSAFRPEPYVYGVASLNQDIGFLAETWIPTEIANTAPTFPNPYAARVKYFEQRMEKAMTNWLLQNQGSKLSRRY